MGKRSFKLLFYVGDKKKAIHRFDNVLILK